MEGFISMVCIIYIIMMIFMKGFICMGGIIFMREQLVYALLFIYSRQAYYEL